MRTARYFTDSEFRKCNPPCRIDDMQQSTLDMMDAVRELAGIPLVINCAYRSREYDKAKGRSGNSAHVKGMGVDIRCNTSQNRMKILRACYKVGVRRIGIGKTFIHIDNDTSLPQDVAWDYYG